MITVIMLFALMIVFLAVGFCFRLAGGVLGIALKLIFCLPCALICAVVGLVLCCTLILIPLGLGCFKLAGCLLNPLKTCMA